MLKPDDARRLVASLDAELLRRRRKNYDALVAQWKAESDGCPIHVLAMSMAWQQESGAQPADFFWQPNLAKPDPRDAAYWEREERMDSVGGEDHIAEQIAVMAGRLRRHAEDIADPTRPKRAPIYISPKRERMPYNRDRPDIMSSSGGDGKPAKKLNRTAIWEEQRAQEVQAKLAHLVPGAPGQESSVWMHGACVLYNSRSMSGTVGIAGGLHLPFEAGAVIEAGITSLHPSQAIEALVTKRADGSLVVAEIRLSVGERAKKLAELERQSQAAEENYRIELMRRQVH